MKIIWLLLCMILPPLAVPLLCVDPRGLHDARQVERSLDAIQSQILDAYVEVRAGEGRGAGTVIEVEGRKLILTAAHVVAGAAHETRSVVKDREGKDVGIVERHYQPVIAYREDGGGTRSWRTEIVLYSPAEEDGGHDLALLLPDRPDGLSAARVGRAELRPGMDCWYVGTPMGLHRSLERSIINQVDCRVPELNDNRYLVTNGHATFGSSGGGLFVRDRWGGYELVGVIVRAANAGTKPCVLAQDPKTIAAFLRLYRLPTLPQRGQQ